MLDYEDDVSLDEPQREGSEERFDLQCPTCHRSMVLRRSRYGKFYGCVGYPECQETHSALLDGSPVPGPLVTRKVKKMRSLLYGEFQSLVEKHCFSNRSEAYLWASKTLGLPYDKGAPLLALLDEAQCQHLIDVLQDSFPENRGFFDFISLGGLDFPEEVRPGPG